MDNTKKNFSAVKVLSIIALLLASTYVLCGSIALKIRITDSADVIFREMINIGYFSDYYFSKILSEILALLPSIIIAVSLSLYPISILSKKKAFGIPTLMFGITLIIYSFVSCFSNEMDFWDVILFIIQALSGITIILNCIKHSKINRILGIASNSLNILISLAFIAIRISQYGSRMDVWSYFYHLSYFGFLVVISLIFILSCYNREDIQVKNASNYILLIILSSVINSIYLILAFAG